MYFRIIKFTAKDDALQICEILLNRPSVRSDCSPTGFSRQKIVSLSSDLVEEKKNSNNKLHLKLMNSRKLGVRNLERD